MIYLYITLVIFIFLIIFYLLGKVISSILNKKFSLEEIIIIGFSIFILLINLNFFYLQTNILLILLILLPLIFLEKNFSFGETIQLLKIFRNISFLIFFSLIIIFIYGYQFIVFRGMTSGMVSKLFNKKINFVNYKQRLDVDNFILKITN